MDIVGAVRRNLLLIGAWVLLSVAGAAAFVHSANPQFVASAQFVLEQTQVAADAPDVLRFFHQLTLDDAQAQTQLHVLLSERLLRGVFDALDLQNAPELADSSGTAIDRLAVWWRPEQTGNETNVRAEQAFARFRDRVRARRIGLSYVIEVSYSAENPAEAARVANAIATAFVRDRLDMAAADASAGFAPFKRRVERIRSERLLAAGSVKTGSVPDAYFPDAAVRLLGVATLPIARAFPKSAPLIGIAFWFGIVSALVVVIALRPMSRRMRVRRHIKDRFGLECLEDMSNFDGRRLGRPSSERLLQQLRAALASRGCIVIGRRIGILAATDGADQTQIAAGLTNLMTAASCLTILVDLADGDALASGNLKQAPYATRDSNVPSCAMTVYAIPPLARLADAQAILPSLDAAILVVGAKRATTANISGALRLLKAAKVPLAGMVLSR